MEDKLSVDVYFSQLPQHRRDVVLVQRSDLSEDITKNRDEIDDLFSNKRKREPEDDGDLIVIKTVENQGKFHQMNIRQLRVQASNTGITNGSKNDPVYIPEDDEINGLVSKKRKKELQEEKDLIVIDKTEQVEKIHGINIRQFSEQDNIRGIIANGSKKKQFLERGYTDSSKDTVEILDDDVIVIERVKHVENFRQMNEQATICSVPEILDDDSNEFVNKKKKTESEEADDDIIVVEVVEDVEKLRQMNIFQLGEQATIRGLPANGSKEQLLEIICADPFDEPGKISDEVDSGEKKKLAKSTKKARVVLNQKLPSEDGDVIVIEKVEDAEKLRELALRQLREQAILHGVSANGSKKQLLERLCAEDSGGKEKLVKATKKGGTVLDQWLPDHIKEAYHVLQHGGEFYDAMLNLTDVGENSNKFCVIQALESDNGLTFMVYKRSGRVGAKGHVKLLGPYPLQNMAIRVFNSRFYAKTQVKWSHRRYVVCRPKCYAWLEMDYDRNSITVAEKSNPSTQPQVSTLDPRISEFISLICNVRMMKQQMMEIGYNAEKLPLGKLSKSTIMKGYDALKRISEMIGQSDKKTLEQLSGEFYTVIPHDFGFKKMREFVIDTQKKLKRKLQMVEALDEIQVATKLLSNGNEEDPMYLNYQRLRCDLTPLDIHSEEYSMIKKYMHNTHESTCLGYTFTVDIVQIFRVSRHGETERFRKHFSTKNRMLLWHGSGLTNWTGILSQGLRVGSLPGWFGRGVYFADMFGKSLPYCGPGVSSSNAVILLCEVALGDMAEYTTPHNGTAKLPLGKLSSKGVGVTVPNPIEHKVLEDGVIVPLGNPMHSNRLGQLDYNEYIVHNADQIRMRYVIHFNSTYTGVY